MGISIEIGNGIGPNSSVATERKPAIGKPRTFEEKIVLGAKIWGIIRGQEELPDKLSLFKTILSEEQVTRKTAEELALQVLELSGQPESNIGRSKSLQTVTDRNPNFKNLREEVRKKKSLKDHKDRLHKFFLEAHPQKLRRVKLPSDTVEPNIKIIKLINPEPKPEIPNNGILLQSETKKQNDPAALNFTESLMKNVSARGMDDLHPDFIEMFRNVARIRGITPTKPPQSVDELIDSVEEILINTTRKFLDKKELGPSEKSILESLREIMEQKRKQKEDFTIPGFMNRLRAHCLVASTSSRELVFPRG